MYLNLQENCGYDNDINNEHLILKLLKVNSEILFNAALIT